MIKHAITAVFVFIFSTGCLLAQVPDSLVNGIKEGDAAVLSSFFNKNLEMVVLSKDDVYSQSQAKEIVTEFFSDYKVKSFDVLHEGGKDDACYAIGSLVTDKGIFRVYFLLKKTNDSHPLIYQLRIEKQ